MNVDPRWPRPSEILTFYQRASSAIRSMSNAALIRVDEQNPFFGIKATDLQSSIAVLHTELEQQAVLLLTASIEATFQVDLQARKKLKKNDHVSNALRRFETRMIKVGKRVDIDDLVDQWKVSIGLIKVMGKLKQVIAYRHWLAHGRYWNQKSGLKEIDPFEVWYRWEAVRDGISKTIPFPLETT